MRPEPNAAAFEDEDPAALRSRRGYSVCYDNVHDWTQAARDVAGWVLDYYQIAPGHLRAYVDAKNVGGIWMMRKQVNLRVEVVGTPPDRHLSFASPEAGQTMWANGFKLGEDDVLMLRPGASAHIMCGPTRIVQAHVPFGVLERAGVSDSNIQSVDSRDGALTINLAAPAAKPLRFLMSSAPFEEGGGTEVEHELAAAALGTIRQAFEQRGHGHIPRSESWRTISRAREYIETNLHRPLRIGNVSQYASASVSKLERTFQRELNVTPSQYILARRLHAVNRVLGSVDRDGMRISDLAMRYGFRHLGRFSAAYRAQFGELPSQTLQGSVA